MSRKNIFIINFVLAGIASILMLLMGGIAFMRPSEIVVDAQQSFSKSLPKGSFVLPKSSYDAIKNSLLNLNFVPPTMQLPNLRNILIYFGPNGRPDASNDDTSLHFALSDARNQASIAPNEPLYLLYDRQQTPPRYIFSPHNSPTSLWVKSYPKGNDAVVSVMMKNENGAVIVEPASNAQFTLQPKEYGRFAGSGGSAWELGKWRVDGTLLSRQRARWFGPDRFLEKHGGLEFQNFTNKQRIDFGENDEIYSVYLGQDDVLLWENDRWKVIKSGKETQGKTIMQLKKIDERLLSFILWDADGKNRINLNLLKSNEQWIPRNFQQDFKFIAARTRSQYVFEINKERVTLKPKDWLVLTEGGWKKLETAEEIDNYVERKITGPLFVFDEITKKDDHQFLVGTLFNASRTDMQAMEIDLSQGGGITVISMPIEKQNPTPTLMSSPMHARREEPPPSIEKINETTSIPSQPMRNGCH